MTDTKLRNRLNEPVPCINCISLPMCRAKLKEGKVTCNQNYHISEYVPRSIILDLYDKCSLLREYVYLAFRTDDNGSLWGGSKSKKPLSHTYAYQQQVYENQHQLNKVIKYITNENIAQPDFTYQEPLEVKVTFINNKYHCRLFQEGILYEELVCRKKISISFCINYMLTWYDKMGNKPYSAMAKHARDRHKPLPSTILDRIERIYPTNNVIYNKKVPV